MADFETRPSSAVVKNICELYNL